MRYLMAICTALIGIGGCATPSVSDEPVSASERAAIADSIRAEIREFTRMQLNPASLCEDPDAIKPHFAFPGGVALSVADTTPVLETQAEWEARGIPASYWCSLESIDIRIDSVVVHVLTRNVAITATPHYFARVLKSGDRYQAKGMQFEAWVRTDDGWKTASAMSQYFEEALPRPRSP